MGLEPCPFIYFVESLSRFVLVTYFVFVSCLIVICHVCVLFWFVSCLVFRIYLRQNVVLFNYVLQLIVFYLIVLFLIMFRNLSSC